MGTTFSSNGRECFGFGGELAKPTDPPADREAKSGGEESTENEYPPGHALYKPKKFKPVIDKATKQQSASPLAAANGPQAASSAADDFRPFLSPRYHQHLHLHDGEAVPYGAEGAQLEPCDQCIRMKRNPPTMVEIDVCMCKPCWEEGTEDMRHVVRHRNNLHQTCPKDFPQSELQYLPDNSAEIVAHWRAEWRHSHHDHELCRPHYLFGCTAVEELQLQQLHAHQRGDHSNCPKEFPEYMLKPSVQDEDVGENDDELGEDTKEIWRAAWKHEHGEHSSCRAVHNFGCEGGEAVPVDNGDSPLSGNEGEIASPAAPAPAVADEQLP